jgi:hypothetical protein
MVVGINPLPPHDGDYHNNIYIYMRETVHHRVVVGELRALEIVRRGALPPCLSRVRPCSSRLIAPLEPYKRSFRFVCLCTCMLRTTSKIQELVAQSPP